MLPYPGESTTATRPIADDTGVDGGRTYERVSPVLWSTDDQWSIDDLGGANEAWVEDLHIFTAHRTSERNGHIGERTTVDTIQPALVLPLEQCIDAVEVHHVLSKTVCRGKTAPSQGDNK